jgi:hypothetical protein
MVTTWVWCNNSAWFLQWGKALSVAHSERKQGTRWHDAAEFFVVTIRAGCLRIQGGNQVVKFSVIILREHWVGWQTFRLTSGHFSTIANKGKLRVAKHIGSAALKADAACSVTCAYMSLTLLAGLLLNRLFGWWWADPLAALVLVYFLVHEGREALHEARTGETCSCEDDCCED